MFILGLLSFFQMTFVPGYILLRLLKFELKGRIQIMVFCFSLSLLFNYLLVYFLTLLKLYKPSMLYPILVLEYGFLFYFLFLKKSDFYVSTKPVAPAAQDAAMPADKSRNGEKVGFFCKLLQGINSLPSYFTGRPAFSFWFIVSIAAISVYFYYFFSHLGTAFFTGDVGITWNRWAVDWYNNRLPGLTWHYPQLIPANWSITYVIMQNASIQFFAKPLMALFPIMTLFLFLDLALKKRDYTYLIGIYLYATLIRHYYDPVFIVSGHVDIAVSFFAFLALYVFFLCLDNEGFDARGIFFVLLFACAAAVTKQAGLYMIPFALTWTFYMGVAPPTQKATLPADSSKTNEKVWFFRKLFPGMNKKRTRFSFKKDYKTIVSIVIIIAVFLSWYVIKEIQVGKGSDASEISYITHDIWEGKTYLQRLDHALEGLSKKWGKSGKGSLFFYTILVFFILGLFHRDTRWIAVFILPYIILWGCFFSYDSRNLNLALPFIAYVSSFGITFLVDKIKRIKSRGKLKKLSIAAGPLLFLVGAVAYYWKSLSTLPLKLVSITGIDAGGLCKARNCWLTALILGTAICLSFPIYLNPLNAVLKKYRLKIAYIFIVLSPLLWILNSSAFNPSYMQKKQESRQRKIGHTLLNEKLYEYHKKIGLKGKILTSYQFMKYLPQLKCFYSKYPHKVTLKSLEKIGKKERIDYILMPRGKISKKIFEKIEKHEFSLIFARDNYLFIKVRE